MFRTILWAAVLAASSISVSAASASNPAAAAGEPGLVGTWRLVRFEDTAKDGKVTYGFGEHPLGYFVYDPTGHLSVQIMRNPPLKPFASGNNEKGTAAEEAQAFEAYAAYFGTYRVDKARHVLHHIVEGGLSPGYTNTDQLRPYKLNGDTLIIDVTDPKTGIRYYRELHRVR
jgi:hypothetical protein